MIDSQVDRHSNSLVLNYLELVKQDSNHMSCIVHRELVDYFMKRECPSYQSGSSSLYKSVRKIYSSIYSLSKLELLTKLSTYNLEASFYLSVESPDTILLNILKKDYNSLDLVKLLDKSYKK